MRQPNFIGPAYTLPSPNVDIQNCRNFFLEKHELGGGKNAEPYYLRSRPKLVKLSALGAGPGRGGFNASNGRAFAVSGTDFYEVTDPANPVKLGTLTSAAGRVGMADNGTQLLIVDGASGYVLTFATGTFLAISDPDFPKATMCAFLDQYIIVVDGTTGRFYFSALSDATNWDGLDFATAEGYPDLTKALVVDHRQVFLFGDQTTEVWVNDGVTPFSRIAGAFIEHGIAAPFSTAKIDNTIFWVGKDANGHGLVFRAGGEGYTPTRISTFALEYAIAGYGDISTSTGYALQFGGHSWYVLNFPNANTTWVYDIATGSWSEWDFTKAAGGIGRFRGEWHCFAGAKHLLGDYENGNLYELQDPYVHNDTEYNDEAAAAITRERTSPQVANENKRISISEVTFDVETGIGRATGQGQDPQMTFRYSKDGGHTWSNEKSASLGKQGEFRKRVKFRRLGLHREFVAKLRITDPVPVTLISAFGEVELRNS